MDTLLRLVDHLDYPRYYQQDFEESVVPFTQKELDEITVIPQEQAVAFWRLNEEPPRFIRGIRDLDDEKYPLKIACDCDFFYSTELFQRGILHKPQRKWIFPKVHRAVAEWLEQLPIIACEQLLPLYFARVPYQTLQMNWSSFVRHWDAVWGAGIGICNIVSEEEEWFLHFSNESVVVFGCTESYVEINNLEMHSLPYPSIIKSSIYIEREARQQKIIREYLNAAAVS